MKKILDLEPVISRFLNILESKYHVILNPDIVLESDVISQMDI